MKRLALLAIPLLLFSSPARSADLYGYEEAPPRVVERTRIIERHYYHQAAPVYVEPRAYYEPRVYHETYYDRPYRHRYAYAGFWRPRHQFGYHRWHRHHHHHRGW